jgi:hypothetical protein
LKFPNELTGMLSTFYFAYFLIPMQVLNGFKSDNAIGYHQPPPAKMIKIEDVSQKGEEEEEETTGEASESEEPLPASANTLSVPMLPSAIAAGKRRRKSPSLHKSNSRTSAATENRIKNQVIFLDKNNK